MVIHEWVTYCLLWVWVGTLITIPLLILFRNIIVNEVVKKYETDILENAAFNIATSILAGVITFTLCFFFLWLIFL